MLGLSALYKKTSTSFSKNNISILQFYITFVSKLQVFAEQQYGLTGCSGWVHGTTRWIDRQLWTAVARAMTGKIDREQQKDILWKRSHEVESLITV